MDQFQSNNTFWEVVEADICAIPNYIKNILTFCNFGNVLSLQKLDNDDIIQIEQMAKQQFKDFLDENTDTTNFVDFFGPIYHKKPDQFAFTCGDKKMIQQLSEYVQSTIRKNGYGYFQGENRRCHSNAKRHGTEFRDASEEELQEELFNGVLNLLQPYGDQVTSLFKKEMVRVTNENGEIKGHVHCVVCDTDMETEQKKKKRRKDYYSQYWNGQKWSLSNFANHHLNKVHPITTNENQTQKQSEVNEETSQSISPVDDLTKNSNVQDSIDKHVADDLLTKSAPKQNDFDEEDSELKPIHSNSPPGDLRGSSNAENLVIDKRFIDEDEDPSLVELEIEPLNDECTVQLNNLRAQLQFNNIQMTNTAIQNKEEVSECEIQLSDGCFSKIELFQIPADGNCLFGATVHQRYKLKTNSDEYKKSVAELRAEVVAHIKRNLQRYQRTIFGRVYAHCDKNEKPDTQNIAEDSIKFIDNYLSKDTAWAGPEAIQAISEIFKANVVIFNEWGGVNCGNSFDSSYKDIITIAFRVSGKGNKKENVPNTQRNHYDSVIKIGNDVLDKCASMLFNNYTKSCSVKEISHVIDIE